MTYSYDGASQLTGINYALGGTALGNLTYAYDLAGRRTTVGGSFARTGLPNALASASYNANNQMTQFGAASLAYDLNGNLTSDGTNTYTWNARNQLVSIGGGVAASFQYDAFGRRVSKTVGGTTEYLYDGVNPVQELASGAESANLLTGLGVDEYFQRTDASGTAANFLTDALGSTLALTNSGGSTLTSYTYEPFGNTSMTGSSTNPFQYTGEENDNTGLDFFKTRYYSPIGQRFISEDPMGFAAGQANLYSLVGNQPQNYADPIGLFAYPWHLVITTNAALLAGYSTDDALSLAQGTADFDFRTGSQGPDAAHANGHSMAGRKPNGRPQTCQQAYKGAQQQLVDDLSTGDTSAALHTIEDSYAAGHSGFQFWPGGTPSLSHDEGDFFPTSQAVNDATVAAQQFLLDMNANLDQVHSGNPINTAKYFPSNPCGN